MNRPIWLNLCDHLHLLSLLAILWFHFLPLPLILPPRGPSGPVKQVKQEGLLTKKCMASYPGFFLLFLSDIGRSRWVPLKARPHVNEELLGGDVVLLGGIGADHRNTPTLRGEVVGTVVLWLVGPFTVDP